MNYLSPNQIGYRNTNHQTTALINCGATGNFIDIGLLSKANFPLQRLPKPIQAYNVDRTTNIKGMIRWKAHTDILFS